FGDLYHGNMRFDVNISVAKKGSDKLGRRTEVKNLNSFRSVEKAAEYEFIRQVDLLEKGEEVVQETRGWNDDKQVTTSQRSKEDAQDYRYMPDADIPPIVLTDEQIKEIWSTVPKLPPQYREEFSRLHVDPSVISKILARKEYADIVSSVLEEGGVGPAMRVANWIASNLSIEEETSKVISPSVVDLLDLTGMTERSEISSNSASELFNALMNGATNPKKIAEERNLLQVSDENTIAAIVDEVMAD